MAAGPQFLLNTSAEIGAGIIYSRGNRRTLFAVMAALSVCVCGGVSWGGGVGEEVGRGHHVVMYSLNYFS